MHLKKRISLMVVAAAMTGLGVSLGAVLGNTNGLSNAEADLFYAINSWPDFLEGPFTLITYAGSLGAAIAVGLLAISVHRQRISLAVLLSGTLAWAIADLMKYLLGRGRPAEFLSDTMVRYDLLSVNNGFPSGHSALAAAVAVTLALMLPRRWTALLAATALLVGLSRIYLGVHLPLDVIGGWAIGIIVGFGVDLLLRIERREANDVQEN